MKLLDNDAKDSIKRLAAESFKGGALLIIQALLESAFGDTDGDGIPNCLDPDSYGKKKKKGEKKPEIEGEKP